MPVERVNIARTSDKRACKPERGPAHGKSNTGTIRQRHESFHGEVPDFHPEPPWCILRRMEAIPPFDFPAPENPSGALVKPEIRIATVDEILDLRHRVLFAGTELANTEFAGDRDPKSLHVAALSSSHVVGCGSLLPSQWEGTPAWQLRCMAVDPFFQGKGLGTAILAYLLDLARKRCAVEVFWCNAGMGAVGFYERHGWRTVPEECVSEDIGPHVRMLRRP